MENRKRRIIIAVISIVLAGVAIALIINEINLQKRNAEFQEKYAIGSSLAGIYEGKVKIIDYSDGSVEYMSFEEYSLISEKEIIVQIENDVFSFKDGKKSLLFSTEHVAWNLFRLGDAIYFEAKEIGDKEPLTDGFLWVYRNSKIEKATDIPIDSGSVLVYGDNLIFTGEGHIIYLYDPETKNKENIIAGHSVCWKEEGKSFLYFNYNGIYLYDIETKTSQDVILLEDFNTEELEINLQYDTIYNEKDNVLNSCVLFHRDFYFTAGLYYFEYDEFVSERDYTYGMEIEREKFLIDYDIERWSVREALEWI